MALLDVIRARPPQISRCSGTGCHKLVEWVTTSGGKRMPVTHPLLVERVHERLDGSVVTVIDAQHVHFVTCPAADTFRKPRKTR